MLLFLGAGASKAFGMPDMGDLTTYVIEDLKKRSKMTYIIDYIIDHVNEMGFKPDIESVLTCVDALKNPKEGIRNAGPYAGLVSVNRKPDQLIIGNKKECEELSKDIRNVIRTFCGFPGEDKDQMILEIYDYLFEGFGITKTDGVDVYTTNYDLCFETYCSLKGCELNDLSNNKKLDLKLLDKEKFWNIYKLHGSSNWMLNDKNRIIISDRVLNHGERTLSGRMKEEVMIYPTTEKYLSRDPYFSLLTSLRNDLVKKGSDKKSNYIVIIGYSFRDMAINNAFIDAKKYNDFRNKTIYLIDPDAKNILKNNIPQMNKIIEPVKGTFNNLSNLDFEINYPGFKAE